VATLALGLCAAQGGPVKPGVARVQLALACKAAFGEILKVCGGSHKSHKLCTPRSRKLRCGRPSNPSISLQLIPDAELKVSMQATETGLGRHLRPLIDLIYLMIIMHAGGRQLHAAGQLVS
jgi:hypothetical protein